MITQILNRTISLEVQYLLPSVLIDYLWELTIMEEAFSTQAFVLTKQTLGGNELQEIRHIFDGACKTVHKVFGFQPVNASILITVQGETMCMEAGNLLEAVQSVSTCS